MLDEGKPDLVIVFPGARGTADMVRRAIAASIAARRQRATLHCSDLSEQPPMSPNPLAGPPVTHHADPETVSKELDYEDMIALSGMFRRWALYEERFLPEGRTRLMLWSSDFERIAAWVGEGWRATDPPESPLLKFLATLERDASRAINLQHAKHWLGLD